MEILDPDIAALAREREKRVRSIIRFILESLGNKTRVQDMEAAVYLMLLAIEEVSHRVIIFDSDIDEDRLIDELVDMLNRYFYD